MNTRLGRSRPDVPMTRPGACPTCGIPVQLMAGHAPGDGRGPRELPVLLEATGMVSYVPPDPLVAEAQWHVRLTYPLHPPRCDGPLPPLPGGSLPR